MRGVSVVMAHLVAQALPRDTSPVLAGVTIGVCAHNEVENLGLLLHHLLAQDAGLVSEIIVVTSGSTDGTDELALEAAGRSEGRIRVIIEPERLGKVSAVNVILHVAQNENIILIDADNIPSADCLRLVAEALADPLVGGVGTHNVPVNRSESLTARVAACMWDAHHQVNLQSPVLGGDVCGLKRVVPELDSSRLVDDWVLETEIQSRGLQIVYAPDALTFMRVPSTFRDYLSQRRRIYASYLDEFLRHGYLKATLKPANVTRAVLSLVRRQPRFLHLYLILGCAESVAISFALLDCAFRRRDHRRWRMVRSSKGNIGALLGLEVESDTRNLSRILGKSGAGAHRTAD